MLQSRRLCMLMFSLALLLCGCASSPLQEGRPGDAEQQSVQQAYDALNKAELCCTRFAQFDFSQALPEPLTPFVMDVHRPVADFGGTRSWFVAFHLPADATPPYGIVFKSTLSGHWLHHSHLFAPSIVLLDAAYRPLRVKDIPLCEYMGWTSDTSGAFGHITVRNPEARYLVVYTSAEQVHGNTYWEQSPTTFSAQEPVKMATKGSFQIAHGPNGIVYVGKLTDRYRSVVDNSICGHPANPS